MTKTILAVALLAGCGGRFTAEQGVHPIDTCAAWIAALDAHEAATCPSGLKQESHDTWVDDCNRLVTIDAAVVEDTCAPRLAAAPCESASESFQCEGIVISP